MGDGFRFRNFVFTAWAFGENWKDYLKAAWEQEDVNFIMGQLELSTENRLHIQGYCELSKRYSLPMIKMLFNDPGMHIERRRGSQAQAIAYCSKEDTRVEPSVSYGTKCSQGTRSDLTNVKEAIEDGLSLDEIMLEFFEVYVKYPRGISEVYGRQLELRTRQQLTSRMQQTSLRCWQDQVVEKLTSQGDRKILWICDVVGNTGKTWLSTYLFAVFGAFIVKMGKKADIAYRYNCEKMVTVDIARSDVDLLNYGLLEEFKNGMIMSSKYESRMKLSIDVQVVVFANDLPKWTEWSIDRYDVWNLANDTLEMVHHPDDEDAYIGLYN